MVYEKKCINCEKIIDFGGRDMGNLPEDAFEFKGEIYCRECVEEFVEFGAKNIEERIEELSNKMQEVSDQLGLNF